MAMLVWLERLQSDKWHAWTDEGNAESQADIICEAVKEQIFIH